MAQSKTDASAAQTFVNELLEVLPEWRESIEEEPDENSTLFAKGSHAAKKRLIEQLDDMLSYCGVIE